MKISHITMGLAVALATPIWAADPLHALPEFHTRAQLLPDPRDLYPRALDCWPSASHFRAELSIEGRLSQRSGIWLESAGQLTSAAPVSASLVARLPLYSATELDHEREREWMRRRRAAEAVGQLLTQLADRQRLRQERDLMRALEKRARQRVISGIVDSSEQVRYMERVADLEGQLLRQSGHIERSRLELLGFCDQAHADALYAHLRVYLTEAKSP